MIAGLPATNTPEGTLRVTIEPAATILKSPIETPGRIVAFAPTQTSRPMTTGADIDGYNSANLL